MGSFAANEFLAFVQVSCQRLLGGVPDGFGFKDARRLALIRIVNPTDELPQRNAKEHKRKSKTPGTWGVACVGSPLILDSFLSCSLRSFVAIAVPLSVSTVVKLPAARQSFHHPAGTGQQIRQLFFGQQLQPCRFARFVLEITLHFCFSLRVLLLPPRLAGPSLP
jgi:hypothetical protein